MRLLIVYLLAGVSTCLAAEPPVDGQAPDAAAAAESQAMPSPDAATAADPAEPASESAPAHSDESATSDEAPDAGASSDASAGDQASAESAAAADSAEAQSERERMDDERLRREGYKVTEIKGEKRYCKKDSTLGSRLNTRTICRTIEQVKADREDAEVLRQKAGQRRTLEGT